MTATEEATPEKECYMADTLREAAVLFLLETWELRCFLGVEHCVGRILEQGGCWYKYNLSSVR